MNTIKDLAKNWWESVEYSIATELLNQYYPNKIINDKEIENIFYNEVIKMWWDSLETEICTLLILKYFPNSSSIFDTGIKEIYLKEHSKEE